MGKRKKKYYVKAEAGRMGRAAPIAFWAIAVIVVAALLIGMVRLFN